MSLSARISNACKEKKVKQTDLVAIGCGSKQTVNNVYHGRQAPSAHFLEIFLKEYKDIDARWLITGEGGPDFVVEDEQVAYGACKDCIRKDAVLQYQEEQIAKLERKNEQLIQQCTELRGKLDQARSTKVS